MEFSMQEHFVCWTEEEQKEIKDCLVLLLNLSDKTFGMIQDLKEQINALECNKNERVHEQ